MSLAFHTLDPKIMVRKQSISVALDQTSIYDTFEVIENKYTMEFHTKNTIRMIHSYFSTCLASYGIKMTFLPTILISAFSRIFSVNHNLLSCRLNKKNLKLIQLNWQVVKCLHLKLYSGWDWQCCHNLRM